MPTATETKRRLLEVFPERQAVVLTEVITSAYDDLVKTSDFNELKQIMKELAQAQKRTEIKVEELADAQKRTEIEVQKTQIEIRSLARGLKETRGELGGLSQSFGYALENETYRMLPKALNEIYGISLKERLIRTEIGGKEINILGKARKNGKEVVVIGEVKTRLDERRRGRDVFGELEEKVLAIREEYKEEPVRVLVTHYATKGFLKKAQEKGVIVVQTFEW